MNRVPASSPPGPAPTAAPAGPRPDRGPAVVPAGTHLALDRSTRRPRPGMVTGGSPWRLLKVTPAADRLLDAWSVGVPVAGRLAERRLAGRLVEAGLAHPRPGPAPESDGAGGPPPAVTTVVPVRDRPAGLAATLAALDPHDDVVVVDDGSDDPDATAATVARRPGTRLALRGERGGPAAARNTGWRGLRTAEVVAFLDADCTPEAGWTARLGRYFSNPSLVAIAPRVVPIYPSGNTLGAYEALRSPLDLGAQPAIVRPGSRVSYVPSAALLVRRSALESLGGFDEDLPAGEDVDLVWRLGRLGWVRYEPSVTVGHPVRPTWRAWVAQRRRYGSSAAPLGERHGPAVAPLVVGSAPALAWGLLLAGQPAAGTLIALGTALATGAPRPITRQPGTRQPSTRWPSTRRPSAWLEVVPAVLAAELRAGTAVATALRRPWWPVAALASLRSRRARRWLLVAAAGPHLVDWWRRRPPGIGPGRFLACALADDLAYGSGVWTGLLACRRPRALRCLLPARPSALRGAA